jgi:hypothetical protein
MISDWIKTIQELQVAGSGEQGKWLRVPYEAENFLTAWSSISRFWRTLAHGVVNGRWTVPKSQTAKFAILMAVLWDVTPQNVTDVYQCFGGSTASIFRVGQAGGEVLSSKASVNIYQAKQRHNFRQRIWNIAFCLKHQLSVFYMVLLFLLGTRNFDCEFWRW